MTRVDRAILTAATLALGWAAPAAAQTDAAPYDRALAAGYKAAILCSAIFIGGRTEAQVASAEFAGIYPEYQSLVPVLPAKVDREHGEVSVIFSEALPPRRAVWHKGTGCTNLPIGTPAGSASGASPAPATALPDARPWPMGDKVAAANFVASPTIAKAFAKGGYGNGLTTGIVIVRKGQMIAERYADGFGPYTAQRTWSVAKSITGTLVAIAAMQAGVDVTKPAPIPQWATSPGADPRQAITLDNLMRMASGLHSDTAGNRSDAVYFGGTAVTEETVQWPLEAKPGTRFRYANNDILLAMLSLRQLLGEERYRNFPTTALFDKLGMTHTVAETDWRGNYISSSQIWTTARDLARFGMFYLRDGVWKGERLLPVGWIRYATTPSGPQPPGPFGYGATLWLLNKSPGVPADSFAAIGNRGQYVVMIPARDLVIVRRGEDPGGASFDIARFVADLLIELK